MKKKSLLSATRRLLEQRDETLPEIAKGAGVPFQWLSSVSQGRIENPGVIGVQKVYDYLNAR